MVLEITLLHSGTGIGDYIAAVGVGLEITLLHWELD